MYFNHGMRGNTMKKTLDSFNGIYLNEMKYPDGSKIIYSVNAPNMPIEEKTFDNYDEARAYFDKVKNNI